MTEVPEGFPKLEKSTRAWKCKAGNADCTRKEPCRPCLGRRNKSKGARGQSQVRKWTEKTTGKKAGKFVTQTGHEENWTLPIRVEVKSGRQVQGIATTYTKARNQSEMSRATGDNRAFGLAAVPDGWRAGAFLWLIHSEDAVEWAFALVEQHLNRVAAREATAMAYE